MGRLDRQRHPTTQLVYEVYMNGDFDQAVGGGYTQAILYVELDALNTIEVVAVAVDGAGNRSAPAAGPGVGSDGKHGS
ncbi:MAG TPA: hypothetical protein VGK28_11515 [Candidatus Dormibacteraeota bacterium]